MTSVSLAQEAGDRSVCVRGEYQGLKLDRLCFLEDELEFQRDGHPFARIPLASVRAIEAGRRRASIHFKESSPCIIRYRLVDGLVLRLCWNQEVIRRAKGALYRDALFSCPQCHHLLTGREGDIVECKHCHALVTPDENLSVHQGWQFGFCSNGLFSLIGRLSSHRTIKPNTEGLFVSFFQRVHPLLMSFYRTLFWAVIWCIVLLAWESILPLASFTAGSWMDRLLSGIRYPLWAICLAMCLRTGIKLVRLARLHALGRGWRSNAWSQILVMIEKGELKEAERSLSSLSLCDHPGLCANLSIAWSMKGQIDKGNIWLTRALDLCPNHPFLRQLASREQPPVSQLELPSAVPESAALPVRSPVS